MWLKSKIRELNYKLWIKNNEPSTKEQNAQRKHKFDYEPKISIIVPMYETKEKYLKELIDSLINQTYTNWELCIADGSTRKYEYVNNLVVIDKRIKYKFLNENKGISENSNEALKLATGDYIALLDHDDILPLFSLHEVVKSINQNIGAEFFYSDEDKILEDKNKRTDPHFKPDYAPDTLLSYNYICHFLILKKSLIDKIGGFRKEFDGSQDYDLILRATEVTNKIVHIPKILYHWRINENSVALNADTKLYAYEAGKRAIEEHLKRIHINAKVEDTETKGIYRIIYEVVGNPKVSIIVSNNDKNNLQRCLNSIRQKTTYSNYEIIVDDETKNIQGEYVILLNSNIEVITPNWIELMLGIFQRKDVGIVGAKLLNQHSQIMHAGMVLGLNGIVGYVNKGLQDNNPGYMSRNIIMQNYNCVSKDLLMISKSAYHEVRKTNKNYSDIDLCLEIRSRCKLIVFNPYVKAYYFAGKDKDKISKENKKNLKEKWKDFLGKEDSYFNPNFKHNTEIIRVCAKKVNTKNT